MMEAGLAQERKVIRKATRRVEKWLDEHPGEAFEAAILLAVMSEISLTSEEHLTGGPTLQKRAGELVGLSWENDFCQTQKDWLTGGLVRLDDEVTRDTIIDLLAGLDLDLGPRRSAGERAQAVALIYQAAARARRRQTTRDIGKADRETGTDDLISFTQVLTPLWIVRLILAASLSRGPLATTFDSPSRVAALTLLDPCAGTGNFIFAAIDTFMDFYQGFGMDEASAFAAASHNCFATDIDSRALTILWMTGQALARSLQTSFNATVELCSGTLGALENKFFQKKEFDCIVTNPPYIGRKLLDHDFKSRLKSLYPGCHHELGHCFLALALDRLSVGGSLGVVTQASILTLANAHAIRARLLDETRLLEVVELGSGVFPLLTGEKAKAAVLCARKEAVVPEDSEIRYSDWNNRDDIKQLASKFCQGMRPPYSVRCHGDFRVDERKSFNFKRPAAAGKLYRTLPALAELADIKQGLATSDNERFLRYSWEVQKGEDWRPYIKGGGMRRWYHPLETLIYWRNDGKDVKEAVDASYPYLKGKTKWVVKNEDFYFKPGLTFSFVSSKLSVREMPEGCIFDVGGSAIFPHGIDKDLLLAYLNSSLAMSFVQDLNPTLNTQVGDLKRLPVPRFEANVAEALAALAREAVSVSRDLYAWEAPHLVRKPLSRALDNTSYLGYRKAHHLCHEKLIELNSRNDELVLKAASQPLDIKESTEILSWVDAGWRSSAQRFKSKDEYAISVIVSALLDATGTGDQCRPLAFSAPGADATWRLGDVELSCESAFLQALSCGGIDPLLENLNDHIRGLFRDQPPLFVMKEKDVYWAIPFAALSRDSFTDETLGDVLEKLKREFGKGRARALFESFK